MTTGMTAYAKYLKMAISLPQSAAEHVKRAVRFGRAPSASAYIAQAIEHHAKSAGSLAWLDEMLEETGGPPTPAEKREVDRLLALTKRRRRAPRARKGKR